jgi:precorrin-4 methylase
MQWLADLKELHQKNKTNDKVIVQCASVLPDGSPKLFDLVFRDFLMEHPILIFSGSLRQPEILAVLKKKGSMHQMMWYTNP